MQLIDTTIWLDFINNDKHFDWLDEITGQNVAERMIL